MKFTTSKSALLDALSITGKGIPKSSTIPILSNFLFEIDGNNLSITAGSMDFFMSKQVEVQGDGSSISMAIPGKKLLDLIKELPDQPLNFTFSSRMEGKTEVNEVKINSITGNYLIPVESGKDYPQMSVIDSHSFEVDYATLCHGISKSIFACAEEHKTAALAGLFLTIKDKKATFTGCSGVVLSTISTDTDLTDDRELIIPVKILTVLQQISSETAKVVLNERNIQFILDDGTVLKSVLIDAKYPDYKSIIPTQNEKHVVVSKSQLIGSLKRVSQFSELLTDVVKITFSDSKCILVAKNTMGENAKEEISIQYQGDNIEVGLSARQLTACLSKIDVDEVNLWLSSPVRPIIIAEDSSTIPSRSDLMIIVPFKI